MNFELAQQYDALVHLHDERRSLQTKLAESDKKAAQSLHLQTEEEYIQEHRKIQPLAENAPAEQLPPNPEDEHQYIRGYVSYGMKPFIEKSFVFKLLKYFIWRPVILLVAGFFGFLFLGLIELISFRQWDDIVWVILTLIIWVGPASISVLYGLICLFKWIISKIRSRHTLKKDAEISYRNQWAAYKKYLNEKAEYDIKSKKNQEDMTLETHKLSEEYHRLLSDMKKEYEQALLDQQKKRELLQKEYSDVSGKLLRDALQLGLVETYAKDYIFVYGLRRMIVSGRADSTKEAINLLIQEKNEEYRTEMLRRQTGFMEKELKAATASAERQADYARQQLEQLQQEAEYSRQRAEVQEEQRRKEKEQEERNRIEEERDRGKEQCRSCKKRFDCTYRYSNIANCAAFEP